ncbi:LOG family protein [Amylibacter sp. SFDW26]|uniref:LOG family protein n=1 Tax=Amylibacter sp. SFDW26 TaxID=2652722 RepID=UPI0012629658|nr:LOG family protein [Amylibacter sp. SFDW26]KAB7614686.1 LOG family protein [Amylibacter sp. SFDW26]
MGRKQASFPNAEADLEAAKKTPDTPQTRAPAYRLAFADDDFLCRDELRATRIQLEMMKPELILAERGIESTVVMFGGARIPDPEFKDKARTKTLSDLSHYYDEARTFARVVTERSMKSYGKENVVVTGGGPGVMEAGNRGAVDAGGASIALNIVLPFEQAPNEYCTPELCFNFHYFATRKIHFLMRAKTVTAFPGGFGTLDELFETLTLIQTGRMRNVPVILFGEKFWRSIVNWENLADAGTISDEDLDLFHFVETAEEALAIMDKWDAENPA